MSQSEEDTKLMLQFAYWEVIATFRRFFTKTWSSVLENIILGEFIIEKNWTVSLKKMAQYNMF